MSTALELPFGIFGRVLVTDAGCWEWQAGKDSDGYGIVTINGVTWRAYKAVYTVLVGAVPARLQLDHLCRNRPCVNPLHLEPVTCRENLLRGEALAAKNFRKTHCHKGHAFDDANTYIPPGSNRRCCRICMAETNRAYRARKAAAR